MNLVKPICITLFTLLAGCAVGPEYQRPQLDIPENLNSLASPVSGQTVSVDWLTWWKSFQDPALNHLLDETAAQNQDLLLAAARIQEAQATVSIARSNRFPSVDGNAGASRAKTSQTTGKTPSGVQAINNDFLLSATGSYEIDFWGKFSRASEAARARLLAQQANAGTVRTTLYANVAQTYFALRANDAQVELADATLKTRQENLRLQEKRLTAGSIGQQDFRQAEAEAAAAEISLAQAQQNQALLEATLAVLVGRTPKEISSPRIERGLTIDALHQRVAMPADLPADLLNRRPDILAAEQNLIAANADIGQAKAQYFPSIKLTSGVGYESRVLSDLIDPSSLLWNLGVGLTQPIFRAGSIGALVQGAEARQQQALAQYVQTVQSAFRDVHDALVNLHADEKINQATLRRSAAVKETLRLVNLRYDSGYSGYLDVLNAQRDLFQVQSTAIDIQRAQLTALVSLYKALGGGWESTGNPAAQ